MTEMWKDIKDYEGLYQISNLGRVKRLAYDREIYPNGNKQIMCFKDKILTPVPHRNNYLFISLSKNNKQKVFSMHRLVALHFIPNPENHKYINHKDENKQNNNMTNLEWCNNTYNLNYGTRNKRAGKSLSKKVKCIETNIIYDSIIEVERQLGIAHNSISRVCLRKKKNCRKLSLGICE